MGVLNIKRDISKLQQAINSYSVTFNKSLTSLASLNSITNTNNKIGQITTLNSSDTPPQYLITITSKKIGTVTGVLTSPIEKSVEARWESFLEALIGSGGRVGDLLEMGTQYISGGRLSLHNIKVTRRQWRGTTPLRLSLALKFIAEDDALTDVVMKVQKLEGMVLPSLADSKSGFLSPPGPFIGQDNKVVADKGDRITVNVGSFLTFNNVILSSVQSSFHPRFTVDGYPIAADVNITLETATIITKELLQEAYFGIKVDKS